MREKEGVIGGEYSQQSFKAKPCSERGVLSP
ncbi:MAG TPA: hypothetical protein DHV15_10495 [Treponema sp.]|uniref:Uncharacterized protein n=1 Tax=Treponema denticola (strain ATCC 35405 / DSM 14222 / CIP 103919 / JCM 8153 / KCTC 15104) TaxID=243275 RepID=Q73LH1_TREDE|nr:hypothetical protein TDE_1892 [Treponema denticola ATCC 35405]HCY95914.1 hypothetical protein [Treponema sp.]